MVSIRRIYSRVRKFIEGPIPNYPLYLPYIQGKAGLEIGGPSNTFLRRAPFALYKQLGTLDNCDFSSDNVWTTHEKEFVFSPGKPSGHTFICEGSQLTPVTTSSYDFVLSSHNLEHFANPVKALYEWKRVLRPEGALILVLPFYRNTFDHNRAPTPVAHMLEDFECNIGEDDLTHLPEILEKHDLSRDLAAGSFEAFKQRSLDNFNNRCLHHHVFDETNSKELLTAAGFNVIATDLARPFHLCLLAHT
jgi:SAM-dependent methyltransferase